LGVKTRIEEAQVQKANLGHSTEPSGAEAQFIAEH